MQKNSGLQRLKTDCGEIRNLNYLINVLTVLIAREETADSTSRSREVRARTRFLKYFRCRMRKKENNYRRIIHDSFGKSFLKFAYVKIKGKSFQRVIFMKFYGADFS